MEYWKSKSFALLFFALLLQHSMTPILQPN